MDLPATLPATGACHCGAVRFECTLDTTRPTLRCNCSICMKSRIWLSFVGPDAFRLLQGESHLAEYRFGLRRIAHRFCRDCGVRVFGQGEHGFAVSVTTLEGVPDDVLAALPIVYADGRHDAFDRPPETTSFM